MSTDRRTLSGIRLLSGLEVALLKDIEERCAWRRYRSGERVFERGTEGHEVFFVVEGAVDVISPTPSGTDLNFARIDAGEVLGQLAAPTGRTTNSGSRPGMARISLSSGRAGRRLSWTTCWWA